MFIHDKSHKRNVCAHLKCFAHRIQSFPLRYSEKRPVNNKQSASFSFSSVESSAKRSAMYVPESDGVSDGVRYRQYFLFLLLEGPRRAYDASRMVLVFVACLIFLSRVGATNFLQFEVVIFFAVSPSLFSCRFRHGTGLMSEARRVAAEGNGKKLAELNYG